MNDNINENINEKEASVSGFDSAEPNGTEKAVPPATQPAGEGYTVTPQGGFYTNPTAPTPATPAAPRVPTAPPKSAAPATPPTTPPAAPKAPTSTPKATLFPNGSYGAPVAPKPAVDQGTYFDPKRAAAASPTPSSTINTPPQPKPEKPPRIKGGAPRRFGIGTMILVSLLTSIICFGVVFGTNLLPFSTDGGLISDKTEKNTSSQSGEKDSSNEGQSDNNGGKVVEITGSVDQLAQVASEKASNSVVGIRTTFAVHNYFLGESTSEGSGSGVIYSEDGYIITNYHVIGDALEYSDSSIEVFLNNDIDKPYEATVINYDISRDLAVIKINAKGLKPVEIADSDTLKVGQFVVAIGSPGGLEFIGSTSFGIVSGLDRKISTTTGSMSLIQTDAAINPGNSGGALVNEKGQLVGINSSKLVDTSFEGMGFAIPSNTVVEICDNLIARKDDDKGDPYVGITVSSSYSAADLQELGFPTGAVISSVDEGSPAEAAGLRRGDIITHFGDKEISEYEHYIAALEDCYPGDVVEVTIYRSRRNYTVKLTVGSENYVR